jgi:hypothetical protein
MRAVIRDTVARLYVSWEQRRTAVAQRLVALTIPTGASNTTSNLIWLAIAAGLGIAAFIFWKTGAGNAWFHNTLNAPTQVNSGGF